MIITMCMHTCRTKWIKTHGQEYHSDDYIIIGKQDNHLPTFSKIIDLMLIVHSPIVEVNIFRTVGLSNHLLSYQIEPTLNLCCTSLTALKIAQAYTAHTFDDGKLYLSVRYCV